MKKIIVAFVATLGLVVTADAKSLVAYYSRSGNTAAVAEKIAQITNSDLHKIETADSNHYPDDYKSTTELVQQEIKDGTLVEINSIPDISQYDTVFVGTPIWWGTMATPVKTFLSQVDLAGKTVIPFNTHGGSGAGNVHTDIVMATPKSNHLNGLAIAGSDAQNSDNAIKMWLNELRSMERK